MVCDKPRCIFLFKKLTSSDGFIYLYFCIKKLEENNGKKKEEKRRKQ